MAAKHSINRAFLERTTAGFVDAMEHAFYAEQTARADGLLQRLDPRVKLLGILALVVPAAASRSFGVIAGLFAIALALAALSRVSFGVLLKRVWIAVLLFTGVIALPAPFVTPGRVVYHLPVLGWSVTAQGLASAGYLVLRVETAATLCVLLVLTTPWNHVLKTLRVFRVPAVLVTILGMTYRYLFLVLQTAHDMFESRRSRMIGELTGRERRRVAVSSAGVLMSKTFDLSNEVYLAMQSRGYRGEVAVLDEFQIGNFDWAMLAAFALVSIAAFWLGR
ncbi:MAG: cobalt ECF transporter T component CbiQ [Terriglobia bacterium]|jgi:cobalt ECF transporter T component CbiQ